MPQSPFTKQQDRSRLQGSIVDGLRHADRSKGLVVLDTDLVPRRVSYPDLAARAEKAARALRTHGCRTGDRICVLAPLSLELVTTVFGIWRLGATAVFLPRPRRSDVRSFFNSVLEGVAAASPSLLLTTQRSTDLFKGRVNVRTLALRELSATVPRAARPLPMPDPAGIGLLQLMTDHTGDQRPVAVTQSQMITNIEALGRRCGFGPDDTYVSWIPLDQTLGIVPLAGLAATGTETVLIPAETFEAQPASWMRTISDYGGTVTAAPGSAYATAAREQSLRPATLALSRVRVALVKPDTAGAAACKAARHTFAKTGLQAGALRHTHGFAHSMLAVAASDRCPQAAASNPTSRPGGYISCGRPLPGTELAIVGADGRRLPDGVAGQLTVRGNGVFLEGCAGPDTAHLWTKTGNRAFIDRGELFLYVGHREPPTKTPPAPALRQHPAQVPDRTPSTGPAVVARGAFSTRTSHASIA